MSFYQRRLPHWDIVGEPLFVTFRLHGSLPPGRIFPPARLRSGKAFVALDHLLDSGVTGPLYLRRPEVAEMVVGALREGESRFRRYTLHAYVVMPNHVHLLVTPTCDARRWLGPLKGFTGHCAHKMLDLINTRFWQDESYDHLVRDNGEFQRIRRYIEMNPVHAGLAPEPQIYPWSSAHLL